MSTLTLYNDTMTFTESNAVVRSSAAALIEGIPSVTLCEKPS